MSKGKVVLFVLVSAIVLGAVLRLWQLGADRHPLLWDEAALGYNGYSILKTGRDEYGTFLPPILRSFGDYKPALYAYTTTIPIGLWGLTEFSTRLPSAMAGVVIIGLVYFLSKELFENNGEIVGVFAALMAIANPWLIHFARGAWEANLNLMLTLVGILAFLKGRKKSFYFVLSAATFSLTYFTYQSAKLFTPIIVIGLLIFFGSKAMVKTDRLFKIGSLIFIFFSALVIFMARGTSGRLLVYNVFAYQRSSGEVATIAAREGTTVDSFRFLMLHGEWLASARRFLEGYFSYFSGRFLFSEGDWTNARLSSPYVGEFYWLDFPFLILGLIVLVRLRNSRLTGFFVYWIILSPLPAALSRDIVSAVRAFNLSIPLILVSSLGIDHMASFISRRSRPLVVFVVVFGVLVVYIWNVAYYLDSYFAHAPVTFSDQRLYGYKEAVGLLREANPENQPVFFTQKMGQPYIYFLFYDKVDPALYQSQANLTENPSGDVGEIQKFENYKFRNIYWPSDRGIKGAFFVGTEEELPLKDIDKNQALLVGDINRPDGTIALRIVKTY